MVVKFFRILKASIRQSFVYEMQYRVNLLVNTLAGFIWTFISYMTINVVGQNATVISGNWTQDQYRLLWSFLILTVGIFATVCKRNVQKIPSRIKDGDLDFAIIKPYNSRTLASVGYFRFDTLLGAVFILFVAIRSLAGMYEGVHLLIYIGLYLILIFLSFIIYYSLYLSIVTIAFWFIGAYNLPYLGQQIMNFSNYPISSYSRFIRIILTVVLPVVFISTVPSDILIEFSISKIIGMIIVALILYLISGKFWEIGLRSYSSASS